MPTSKAGRDIVNADLKACCAATYQLDIVSAVLGDYYHPGGLALSRRLGEMVGLGPGMRVADIASGPGTTAMALAETFHVSVVGLELGGRSAAAATRAARERGLGASVRFVVGDAERAPLAGACVDAVFCECALCTFPDKATGVAEMARLLVAGGRIGIADVVLEPGCLPPELEGAAAWIGCLAGALPAAGYRRLLEDAGLVVLASEPHGAALVTMVDQVEARLVALKMSGHPLAAVVDLPQVHAVADRARQAAEEGQVGYQLLVAEKPASP
ncbi:MAG: hypothetical protein NVSMB32_07850 [Actinomycetota bacterium]